LMQIADGRKTVESIRADTAKRVAKHDKQTSPLASGENRDLTVVGPDKGAEAAAADIAEPAVPTTRKRWADMTSSEQMHRMVPRTGKAVAKADPDCASWLHVILMWQGPAVLQKLEAALASQLGIDADEIPAPAPTDDGLDIPEYLRRSAS